jgi:uncharacterized protein (TIGR03437 family)
MKYPWLRAGLFLLAAFAAMGQTISFQAPSSSPGGQGPLAAVTGDFNGDGKTDLAIANSANQTISVMLGKGDGTFLAAKSYSLPPSCAPNYLAVGDFKKDGKPDLLALCLLGNMVIVLPGIGDGTFGTPVITQLSMQTLAGNLLEGLLIPVAVADFTGDGNLDLVLSMGNLTGSSSGTTSSLNVVGAFWLKGAGDGTFQVAAKPLNIVDPLAMVAADFDRDGKPDLAIFTVNSSTKTVSLSIAMGQGDGTFVVKNTYPVTDGPNITIGDFNGDGVPDIALSGGADLFSQSPGAGLAIYIGKGDGSFTAGQNLSNMLANSVLFGVLLGDCRGTGRQDLVAVAVSGQGVTNATASLVGFAANGDGTFAAPVTIADLGNSIPFGFTSADFNGDGRTDLAVATMDITGITISFKGVSTPAEAAQAAAELPAGSFGVALNAGTWAEITGLSVSGGTIDIAQNAWVEIYGRGLAPASLDTGGVTWSTAPSFASHQMPASLQNVSAMVNGKPAYIYYASPTQVNVLTPLDPATGPVSVTLNNGTSVSAAFTANLQPAAPGFLRYGDYTHIAALHANFAYLGPASMGAAFTPAKPGEIILLFGDGFGLPVTQLTAGSEFQSGALPSLPQVTIGGATANVAFAGLISPGLYQINVTVPLTASSGDNQVIATYGGASSPAGAMIPVSQ